MIIEEIGWNFLGNLNLAKKMIKSAHQTSQNDFEDCLKTNLFSAFSLVRAVSKMVVTKGLTKENDKQEQLMDKYYSDMENVDTLRKFIKEIKDKK